MQIRIVGSGLIGTSIGLRARSLGAHVVMVDSDEGNARLAQDLMGGPGRDSADLVVFALPTSKLDMVIDKEFQLNPKATFMDVGSVKTKPQDEIDSVPGLSSHFCGTHPMAGRETGGPEAARADLFEGRAWILCPSEHTLPTDLAKVRDFILSLGANVVMMSASEHDKAVALISHLPQVLSSLLAAQLVSATGEVLSLAGQGLRDTTRIAHSDPLLWKEIISMNRQEILPLLVHLQEDLGSLISQLDREQVIEDVIAAGRKGVERIPGKHGGRARDYFYLPIVIEDKPGQLAALFDECSRVEVNVEDLTIEHSPGQFTGLISLALSKSDGEKLSRHLSDSGWKVHSLR